jgi:hypothetical protein
MRECALCMRERSIRHRKTVTTNCYKTQPDTSKDVCSTKNCKHKIYNKMTITTVKVLSGAAALISGIAIFSCIIFVPQLISEIQGIRNDLDIEMSEFRVCSALNFYLNKTTGVKQQLMEEHDINERVPTCTPSGRCQLWPSNTASYRYTINTTTTTRTIFKLSLVSLILSIIHTFLTVRMQCKQPMSSGTTRSTRCTR